jgi:hypothetical protein
VNRVRNPRLTLLVPWLDADVTRRYLFDSLSGVCG